MPNIPIAPPSHNMSRSLLVEPEVKFQIQQPDEKVKLIVRKHPITQFYWIFNVFILIGLLILLHILLPEIFGFTTRHLILIEAFGFVFIFSYAWLNFLLWYFTVGIVTNIRILDLDFYNIIYKEFTASVIAHVSEISTRIGGFFGSLFDFGDVLVKTQGFEQNIEFDDIPQPAFVVKVINELMVQAEKD